jgi:hypothetical protein
MQKRNIVITTIAAAATVAALGMGGAQAASNRLLGSNDIKDHSIKVKDLAPSTVTSLQGKQGPAGPAGADGVDGKNGVDGKDGAQGPAGPAGAQGPAGPAGADGADGAGAVTTYTRTDTVAVPAGEDASVNVGCATGDVATGGGVATHGDNVLVYENIPDYVHDSTVPNGWMGRAHGGTEAGQLDVWVVCVAS